MNDFPSPAVAASLWTFGRETPVDGDNLALSLMWERKTRDYFAQFGLATSWGSEQ